MEGANGPQGPRESGFSEPFIVNSNYIDVPRGTDEVTTFDAQGPGFEGWTGVENHRMCIGEPDAPPLSLWKKLGSAAGATAAAVTCEAKRKVHLVTSVAGDVITVCENTAGCPGITSEACSILTYGSALILLTGAHYFGYTVAQPMPADPTEATEAEEAADMGPPA